MRRDGSRFSGRADDIAHSRRKRQGGRAVGHRPRYHGTQAGGERVAPRERRILSSSPIRRATICRSRCGRSRSTPNSSPTALGTAVEGETAEFLDFLRSAATRMEMLVRDLLAYTQVTRLDAPLEEADANEALAEALANLGGAIAESGATVTCDRLPPCCAHTARTCGSSSRT